MPWHISTEIAGCDGFAVVKDSDGEVEGCHPTREAAESQLQALYAAEPEATRASASCSCSTPGPHARAAALLEPLDQQYPVPAYPPRSWFTERPSWLKTPNQLVEEALTAGLTAADASIAKIQVDDHGRVAGYFYPAGQCLVHDPGACPRPSPTKYSAFHQQHVMADDGELVSVGVIGNTRGHADPRAPVSVAMAHYADPTAQLISCRAYDDEAGGYILGALVPTATYGDVALIRRSALSGDWRPMPAQWWAAHDVRHAQIAECEGFDCIGPTLVNRPGLPLVRAYRQASGEPAALLGGMGGVQLDQEEPTVTTRRTTTIIEEPVISTTTTNTSSAAILAAQPPPNGPPMEDEAPAEGDLAAEVADLRGRLEAVEAVLAELVQGQAAAMAASLEPLPTLVAV